MKQPTHVKFVSLTRQIRLMSGKNVKKWPCLVDSDNILSVAPSDPLVLCAHSVVAGSVAAVAAGGVALVGGGLAGRQSLQLR